MVKIPVISGLNVYDPSSIHLMLLAKAQVVYLEGNPRFETGFYIKKGLIGPNKHGAIDAYHVVLSNVKLKRLKFDHTKVPVPRFPKNTLDRVPI